MPDGVQQVHDPAICCEWMVPVGNGLQPVQHRDLNSEADGIVADGCSIDPMIEWAF